MIRNTRTSLTLFVAHVLSLTDIEVEVVVQLITFAGEVLVHFQLERIDKPLITIYGVNFDPVPRVISQNNNKKTLSGDSQHRHSSRARSNSQLCNRLREVLV